MIRQVSVFVENKPGSLMDVTSRLTEAGVNIRAVATFDTPEFGILRMVVDKPDEAKEYLTKLGYVVRIHEVMGVALEDKKGNLNQMLAILAKGELNIIYNTKVFYKYEGGELTRHGSSIIRKLERTDQRSENRVHEQR